MASAENTVLVDRFEQFFRHYYDGEIKELARGYPNERSSLFVDWSDLYRFDPDLADDYLDQPGELRSAAEEALRLYDLPIDIKLDRAHVRVYNLPAEESPEIREIRAEDMNQLVQVRGIVRKATGVRPKIQVAAFECQLCGNPEKVTQNHGEFQEPHQCESCERKGPFKVSFERSEFIDSQKLRIQESPEGLRGGETPEAIDITIEDDITGEVTPGDHVSVTGVLRLEQQGNQQEKSPLFDFYMEGTSIEIDDEQFEEMDITDEDKAEIVRLSSSEDIYDKMVDSIAPSIFGYDEEKLALTLQLFSGVRKHLPDGSRIRGDLHMLLIGDPGTGKCVTGDTKILLADGREKEIQEIVESNLTDPNTIQDGWWDDIDLTVPSLQHDGTIHPAKATRVWKREAPERMFRIRTRTGRELTVTPTHPLFINWDGRPTAVIADELREGMFIATPRSVEPSSVSDTLNVEFRKSKSPNAVRLKLPEEWTPALARFIGYTLGEGYVHKRPDYTGFVSVSNNDDEIITDLKNIFDDLGVNYFIRNPHPGKDATEIISSAGELVSFLENLDPSICLGSSEQRIPSEIYQTSPNIRKEFCKAYIEGECHVSNKEREISVSSTSRELLEGIRTILISLSIRSQLHDKGQSHRLRISGSAFDKYVREIGFITDRKEAVAREYCSGLNTNLDVIPGLDDKLRQLRSDLSLSQNQCGIPRTSFQHYERGSRDPSRCQLEKVVSQFEDELRRNENLNVVADGGTIPGEIWTLRDACTNDIFWDRIESIELVTPEDDWVYDLEVAETHNYISNGIVSHNSQLLSYIKQISPRSVYTSGKGSTSAGLTASAVRDDFGDGQQWSLEAGALVLADQGIAAVDELDKMAPDDRSAMHEALEQQQISISKAGINATLQSRCSLLGAANPKYGRFDPFEPIAEQIDLEPALVSRFDLIFIVTDTPDPDEDSALAEHILTTNYAGELTTQRDQMHATDISDEEVASATQVVDPAIDPELLRKYVAHAKQSCHPRMTDEAREAIRDFYVDLRSRGADQDSPVPVTARKLEGLVRLAEASARVRLSDTVTEEDAERVIEIVRSSLEDIGVDPETGEFDADIVEAGTSKTQRDRIKSIRKIIGELQQEFDDGAPLEEVLESAADQGIDRASAEHEIDKLKQKGEVYEPNSGTLRTT